MRVTDDLYKNSVCVVVGKSVTTADLIKCERSGIDNNGQSQLSQGNLLVKGSKEVGSNRQEIQGFFKTWVSTEADHETRIQVKEFYLGKCGQHCQGS